MKSTFTVVLLLCFGISFSQDCLKSNLYNPYDDLHEASPEVSIENEVYKMLQKPDSLQIIALPTSQAVIPNGAGQKNIKAFKVIIVNNSATDFNASNMDGRILFTREVYYNNNWVTIQPYVDRKYGFCGNSFMVARVIQSGQTLTYIAPCLEGTVKAKFRLVMRDKKTGKTAIYSNVFEGLLDERLVKG